MEFKGGVLKSPLLDFVKMVHFASYTDLVDLLRGASIRAATTSEKSCSLIADALGVRYVDLGLTYSNSNWTFIVLNLPYLKGTLRRNKTKKVNKFKYQRHKKPNTTGNARGED